MSETTNLKLKKHDNVETNTDKFDIENYLNGNWDKIDENVGEVNTNISNINSKNTELEKELKEMQEDFYQNSIRGQASGEYIHVEDSSNCRARIGIGGNSEQETREGYNLLNFDVKQDSRVTYNKEDGTVTINGQGGFYLNLDRINLTANKTYKQKLEFISGSAKTSSGTDMKNQAVMSLKVETWLKNDNYIAHTFEEDTTKSGLWLNANVNFDNAKIRIWAYEGTEDKPYEQYGVSPSPDYPSSIVAVGSNVNLANKDNITNLYFNQNQISVGSTSKTMIENCLPNTTYTISKIKSTKFRVCTTNKTPQTNESIIDYTYNDNGDKITITTSDKAKYMCIYYYDSGTDTLEEQGILDSIKIEKGKVATPYSKYGQGCVKVTKCNKNLFPALKSQSKENKGIIFSYNAETQEFRAKGTTTDTSFYTTLTFEELKYLSKDKKYILSISNLTPKKCMVALTKINVISNGIINPEQKQTTVDNLNKYKPDGFMFYGQNLEKGTKIDFTFKAQIEESSTESTFEQHEEQSYIMPVQKEMLVNDYLDYDNEEEVHTWGKKILDGTENWAYEKLTSADGEKNNFYLKIDDAMSNGKVYSNAFVQRPTLADNYSMYISAGKNLNLRYQEKSSSTDFKAYLKAQYDAGTPVVVYYQLATPIRLKFTDEQKAVAKELNNARTYKNVTNITTDSKAILSLDYAKDLETLLNNTQALAVNNASEGV